MNDLERAAGTYLYGRRMYEVMVAWETMPTPPDESAAVRDYAELWRAADKVVYSKTLTSVSSTRTRLEQDFDVDAIRRMKAEHQRDISIGGPALAAVAFAAGLVDECRLFLHPVSIGRGNPALPTDTRVRLGLVEQRRFDGGVVFLRYRTRA